MLKINKKFAKKYDEYRRKEELQKLKDKYGDAKPSDVERRPHSNGATNATAASSSDSSDSDSDSDVAGWTPGTEAGFLRVYAALESGDSRLYDSAVSWFKDDHEAVDQEAAAADAAEGSGEKYKPMYYNEYHRKYLLEGAYEKDDTESAAANGAARDATASQGDLREAEQIRKRLAETHAKDSDSDDEDSDDGDAFLTKRRSNGGRDDSQGEDATQRLHKFISDETDPGEDLDDECREDLAKLKRRWKDANLTESERYLRDFITKEFWRRPPRQQAGAVHRDSDDNDDEADEAFLARQSEFEAKWNARTEERDPGFESGFRRTFASGDGDNADAEEEDDDDDELFVVAEKPEDEKANDDDFGQVAEELLQLEQHRGGRRQVGDGSSDEEADVDDDDDSAPASTSGVRTYPRHIADSLRQAAAESAGAVRSRRRTERRDRRREEKLTKRRELEELARLKEAELEQRLDRLRRNAGLTGGSDGGGQDRLADTLGGDFLEADFDPAEHDKRMASLFGGDFYDDGKVRDGETHPPQFSDDDDDGVKTRQDAAESAEELRRRLQDEADRVCAEDFIRSGPGQQDLRCRFNYRQVEPNDFGLSAAEILLADDRELNAWCSVRKASQYRERDADRRDRRRYRCAHAQTRKASVMPGMVKRLEAAAAFSDADAWLVAMAAGKYPDGANAAAAGEVEYNDESKGQAAEGSTKKKRRRQRTKKKLSVDAKDAALAEASGSTAAEATPRSRKRRSRRSPPPAGVAAATQKEAKKKRKLEPSSSDPGKKGKKMKKKAKRLGASSGGAGADRLQISERRLLELGIDPKKFRRMRGLSKQQRQQQQTLSD